MFLLILISTSTTSSRRCTSQHSHTHTHTSVHTAKDRAKLQYTKAIICSFTEGHINMQSAPLCKASENEDVNFGEHQKTTVCRSCHRHFYEPGSAALTCCRFHYTASPDTLSCNYESLIAVNAAMTQEHVVETTTCINTSWQTGDCLCE